MVVGGDVRLSFVGYEGGVFFSGRVDEAGIGGRSDKAFLWVVIGSFAERVFLGKDCERFFL